MKERSNTICTLPPAPIPPPLYTSLSNPILCTASPWLSEPARRRACWQLGAESACAQGLRGPESSPETPSGYTELLPVNHRDVVERSHEECGLRNYPALPSAESSNSLAAALPLCPLPRVSPHRSACSNMASHPSALCQQPVPNRAEVTLRRTASQSDPHWPLTSQPRTLQLSETASRALMKPLHVMILAFPPSTSFVHSAPPLPRCPTLLGALRSNESSGDLLGLPDGVGGE